jgi:fimbrial chaperone protein
MRGYRGFLAIVLTMIGFALPAAAFRLIPIEMNFEPSGRGATQIFRVENDKTVPVAIEVSIIGRGQDQQGEDTEVPMGDDWVLFPEQIILQPGESQSVRVQWIGDATLDRERAFRLIAAQQAIDFGETPTQGGQVKLLVQYKASLYVAPIGTKPQLSLVAAAPGKRADGPGLDLDVRNDGNAHGFLRNPLLTLEAGGKSLVLKADRLDGLANENVLAGVTRRFSLPWPTELPVGPVKAKLELTPP